MNVISKLKAFAWILGGGIVGAVALTSSSVILVLLISGAGTTIPLFGHIVKQWTERWTIEGTYAVFIAAGCVGFVFGALAGMRHGHIIRKWFSAAIIGGIPMIFVLWLIYACAMGVQRPREMKLADCTNDFLRVHLKTPKGHTYRLVFATPSGSINVFSTRVNIFEKATTVTNLSIGSNQTEAQCDFLRAQTDYDIEIKFDRLPPSSTSVWLHWEQAYKDRDR